MPLPSKETLSLKHELNDHQMNLSDITKGH